MYVCVCMCVFGFGFVIYIQYIIIIKNDTGYSRNEFRRFFNNHNNIMN